MNRFRINEIMEMLLFPYCDTELAKKDYLLEKCLSYQSFLCLNMNDVAILEQKKKKGEEYRRAVMDLIHYLVSRNHGRVKSYDDTERLCDYYFPVLEIERMIEAVQEIKQAHHYYSDSKENIGLYYIHNLRRIAESLLTYRDGVASIRTWNNTNSKLGDDIFYSQYVFDKVEVWNILCRFIVPDILIVIFAVDSGMDETALYEQKPNISLADKLLVQCLRKGMAENHLHFNAGFDYEMIWIHQMRLAQWYGRSGEQLARNEGRIFQATLFRCMAAGFLQESLGQEQSFTDWVCTRWNGVFAECIHLMCEGESLKAVPLIPLMFWEAWERGNVLDEQDYLLVSLYKGNIELKTSSEFLLLYQCYQYISRTCWDTGFILAFLQYLRIKNCFFQEMQQRFFLPGLRHFQEYFNHAKEKEKRAAGISGMVLDVFRSQAKIAGLKKLEIRIAPDADKEVVDCFDYHGCREIIREQLCRQLFNIFYLYRRYILEQFLGVSQTRECLWQERLDKTKEGFSYRHLLKVVNRRHKDLNQDFSVPTIGIVYHFIKRESLDNVSGYYCWKILEEDKLKYSGHRFALRQRMANTSRVIEEIRETIPCMHEYIVGLDAASDENAMEPWMLSPAYNLMRTRDNTKPVMKNDHNGSIEFNMMQNIGFTYHVGEDFRHIVSGLRHIDEVIEELHYKPGDRLGHALALGIDIKAWGDENEVIPVPLLEHLENLLWIWGKYVYDGLNLPIQMERLEEGIMGCAELVYRCVGGLTVRMLYKAYKKKFSVKHKEILETFLSNIETGAGSVNGVYCRYSQSDCDIYWMPWTEEKLLSTFYCPVFEEKYSKVILVPITKADIETYQILQVEMLKKVGKKGIYIETNPTSNLTIGEFPDFRQHPIFRMGSKYHQENIPHVMVTVNSDDPAVFNTNVENELAYIYYAAEYCGYAKEDALEWLETIRQNGMNASFVHHVKSAGVLLDEIGGILDALDAF